MESTGVTPEQTPSGTLWTIGHSTREWEAFVEILHEAGIECLVDVRRFAGSRRNPQYSPLAMGPALQAAGIDYVPIPELGGRRAPQPGSLNGAWRVAAFRGYADNMTSAEYEGGRARLMRLAAARPTTVMCAEAVWWRCHRRLISDDFILRGWQVLHLMALGKVQPHPLNPAARMCDGVVRYPAQGDAQPALL